jgi:DNA-binding NarL/FixJ family response regulator
MSGVTVLSPVSGTTSAGEAQKSIAVFLPARHDPLAGLSAQERKILELIGEGLTNRQIGERMFLAEKTVKNYVSALFAKLGMHHRTQAAAYAVRAFGDHRGTGDGEPRLGLRAPAIRT